MFVNKLTLTLALSCVFLFAGEKAGSKLEKAKKLGIDIIDEAEIESLIQASDPQ